MPDHKPYACCNKAIGDRDSLLRIAGIVFELDSDFLPKNASLRVDVFDCQGHTVLD